MAIYSRFGDPCRLVRFATTADVKNYERRRADKQDKARTSEGWRFIAEWTDEAEPTLRGKDFLADIAYLRADGGLAEILDEAAKLEHPSPKPQWLQERVDAFLRRAK